MPTVVGASRIHTYSDHPPVQTWHRDSPSRFTIPRPSINIRSKGQRSKSRGQKVQKKLRRDIRAAPLLLRCDAAQRDGAARPA